jgi:hypothetical protein
MSVVCIVFMIVMCLYEHRLFLWTCLCSTMLCFWTMSCIWTMLYTITCDKMHNLYQSSFVSCSNHRP